ncbi:FkbM family methyltransferase [Novipirellula artificiosorum]|uniref:FkbM family methyltransferase n=1 Tax=Novipirellula artificiosorum TaxID=2528016 RepID=UPI001E54AFFD|nr:FkbM family methyltransferase [Novipirellula artificiosorum]
MKKLFPRRFWRYKFNSFLTSSSKDELRIVSLLCEPNKTSVDIGADAGVFSANMLQVSRNVIAFEPRPAQADELKAMFTSVGASVRVEQVALSDHEGTSEMRVLINDQGRSTIESENRLDDEDNSPRTKLVVNLRRLDDYALDSVGCIKIDVEGHEVAVLRGTRETIARHRPKLLIESENRHRVHAVDDLKNLLHELDYEGFFLLDGQLHSIDKFSVEEHQDDRNIGSWKSGWERRGVYINNFLFIPREQSAEVVEAMNTLFSP